MAPLIQLLDRVISPLPAHWFAPPRGHQHPDRRTLAWFESAALGMGLTRGVVHPAGGCREEDFPPSLVRACLYVAGRRLRLMFLAISLGTNGGIVTRARLAGY